MAAVKQAKELNNQIKSESGAKEAIGERNRIALAYMELAKDRTFQKLAEEEKLNLVNEVMAIGDEVANWVKSEYGTNDSRKIAARLGVKIFGADERRKKGSEYCAEKKEIIISRDFHEKLMRQVKSTELAEHLLKYVVAHELFRHLEISRIGEVYKRFKFVAWRIGPLVRSKEIKGLSAVASQAFTQSLIGLEISPQVFDYLAYILYTNP